MKRAALSTLLVVLCCSQTAAAAQEIRSAPSVSLSGHVEDRLRRDQLMGRAPLDGFLMRRPSLLLDQLVRCSEEGGVCLHRLDPELEATWNSDLPFGFNDGALWAGRGWSVRLTSGLRARWGRVTLILAPEYLYSENLPFQVIPYPPAAEPPRSRWAHPYHPLPESLDWPIRFGGAPIHRVHLGQSSLSAEAGPLRAGVATENVWWGPGIFNGIALSNQGPGFPHAFVSTARPVSTPIGDIEATWLLGRLDESDYFDLDPTNDHRTLSGALVTFRTAFDPGLTLGLARVVFAPLPEGDLMWGAALDFARGVGLPNSAAPDSLVPPGRDQISELFLRWAFPPGGFELYAEWARFEQPKSFMDFLEFPMHSQGYTVGLHWLDERESGTWLRVQLEHTNLEPATTFRFRRVWTHYSSQSVIHGYTHRGQMLGAAIGPASSGQWLAVDHGWPSGVEVGAFAGRIRRDNAVLFTEIVPDSKREDVTLFTGVRGAFEMGDWALRAELTRGIRLNYLNQSFPFDPETGAAEGVDIPNTSVTLALSRALIR